MKVHFRKGQVSAHITQSNDSNQPPPPLSSQAHVLLHDYEAAEQSFHEVLQLEPEKKVALASNRHV